MYIFYNRLILISAKAPPNLPPGVPLFNPAMYLNQAAAGALPPYLAAAVS